jgi:hypothetical protein
MAAYLPVLLPTLGTILVAIFTALFGIYNYRKQKQVDSQNYVAQKVIDRQSYAEEKETDRKIELRNRRMKDYESYLTTYRGYISLYDFDPPPADNDEDRIKAINEYWLAYSNLFQIASDSVLLAVADFHELAWLMEGGLQDEAYEEEFRDRYATMIIEMRKDAFEKTELQKNEVEQRLPFSFSPASKPAKEEQVG